MNRMLTHEVAIGEVPAGGLNPIRIQSMASTPTQDVKASTAQVLRLIEAGAEYVRLTVPTMDCVRALADIKRQVRAAGFATPLIADVHFSPDIAEAAARVVEKVRINPGNYVDRHHQSKTDFTEAEYNAEIERIHFRMRPLLDICRQYGTALRIGSNHGSLSDRIMSRWGDTPEGMVASAMEFVRICEAESFDRIVLSMKSSNPRVMTAATRLLVQQMQQSGTVYPIHIGVTEAGAGEEGRIKSAVGTASLLSEGIGDTIRVSLTEDPVEELPVARFLVSYMGRGDMQPLQDTAAPFRPEDDDRLYFRAAAQDTRRPEQLRIVTSGSEPAAAQFLAAAPEAAAQTGSPEPVILHKCYRAGEDHLYLKAACDFGPALMAGRADGLWMETAGQGVPEDDIRRWSLAILQACRRRRSAAEFISCPSCGRTRFDITSTAARIRRETGHLKHLKIGIMGCIVNGPGEMADADYGYVGEQPGLVTLYRRKEVVRRHVPEAEAVEALIELIKSHGDWVEKTQEQTNNINA